MSIPSTTSGSDAAVGVVAGHSVALHYGNIAAEYDALRSSAMLVDRSARGRMSLEGPQATEVLAGLVTNDVLALAAGHGQYAAALTPKGKIVADLRIFARDGSLLVDAAPRATAGWWAMVRKYVNPRLAAYHDQSAALRDVAIVGVGARRMLASVTGLSADALGAMAPYAHVAVALDGHPAMVARIPDLELEGFEIFIAADAFAAVWQRMHAAGATPAGLLAWEIARIEAGRPEWGVDIDETTLPQEANLDELHAISYTKGCYVGQEVVARVHFRGHVNRHLRGLLCGQSEPPPLKALLLDDAGKQVGDVRSSALSPRLGAVALAMVRREVEPGTTLTVQWEHGEGTADVSSLPFPL